MLRAWLSKLLNCLILVTVLGASAQAAQTEPRVHDVLIVGGGIAGLATAWKLKDRDLLVLEKEDHPGGRALNGHYQGITYARGAEYLGRPEGLLAEMLAAVELSVGEIAYPGDLLFSAGRTYVGELGRARLLVEKSSYGELQRFVQTLNAAVVHLEAADDDREVALSGLAAELDTLTAEQWLTEQGFSEIYRLFATNFARGLFGADLTEISAATLISELAFDFGEIGELQDEEDLLDEFGDQQHTGIYAPAGGLAEIPQALARILAARVRYGHMVTSVSRSGDLFDVSCRKSDGSQLTFRSRTVVLATPAPVSLELAKTCLSQRQHNLLAGVRYSPYLTVALYSDTPLFNRGFNLGILGKFRFTDIYDGSWVWRHSTSQDHPLPAWVTLVYVAPHSSREQQLLTIPEGDLLKQIKKELAAIIPGSAELITGHEITRFRYGYPLMAPGSGARMRQLAALDGRGLVLAGDYLLNPTFEAAVESGEMAAEKVVDWLTDP